MITVLFSCTLCGLVDAECPVEERSKDEPMDSWMHKLTQALVRTHKEKSPKCQAPMLQNVKIPIENPEAPLGTKETRQ